MRATLAVETFAAAAIAPLRSARLTSTLWRSLLLLLALTPALADAERIKDLAQIQGVRTGKLVGYGLVVGLDSTGDQTSQAPFTVQSLNNMLAQLGVTVPANVTPQLKNVAAVAVHAVMPAFVEARANHRRHGELHRQCQKPARRFTAPGHAPARPRWTNLCSRAGNVIVSGFRSRRHRRIEAHGECAEFGAHSERCHGRAFGPVAARARRYGHP